MSRMPQRLVRRVARVTRASAMAGTLRALRDRCADGPPCRTFAGLLRQRSCGSRFDQFERVPEARESRRIGSARVLVLTTPTRVVTEAVRHPPEVDVGGEIVATQAQHLFEVPPRVVGQVQVEAEPSREGVPPGGHCISGGAEEGDHEPPTGGSTGRKRRRLETHRRPRKPPGAVGSRAGCGGCVDANRACVPVRVSALRSHRVRSR